MVAGKTIIFYKKKNLNTRDSQKAVVTFFRLLSGMIALP